VWHLGVLVRYADDFVVLCRDEAAAVESRRRIGLVLEHLRLQLHPDKTRLVDVRRGRFALFDRKKHQRAHVQGAG
jgi:RNA-directed DNA polymerase